jgi:hypothetical protein
MYSTVSWSMWNPHPSHIRTPYTEYWTPWIVRKRIFKKTNLFSILINLYRNLNVSLPWYQDNEPIVDNSSPIASLSVGCSRRFRISNKNSDDWQSREWLEQKLHDNSIFVMKPGLQTTHYHMLAPGARDAVPKERGVRFSLTFWRLQKPLSPTSRPTPPKTEHPTPKLMPVEPTPVFTRGGANVEKVIAWSKILSPTMRSALLVFSLYFL